jgi:hypothetical protein
MNTTELLFQGVCLSELVELLKSRSWSARISVGYRWLVWGVNGQWVVYECKAVDNVTLTVIETDSLSDAIALLSKG